MRLLPDVERIVSAYLRSRDEITALVDDRVYTEIPAGATFPLVRVVRIAGAPIGSQPAYLDVATLQVDAYGGRKAVAHEIAQTVRAVLDEASLFEHDGGSITNVVFGQFGYVPDSDLTPPQPRYVFDVDVYARPASALS